MLVGLYIIVDDDFSDPVYGDPEPGDIDETVWTTGCEAVSEALDGEGDAKGATEVADVLVAWHTDRKVGLSFLAMASSVKRRDLQGYLKLIAARYSDEVEDLRDPDRAGVEDVVVDVIPPWDDGDEVS